MSEIRVFNTLTGKKETFEPLEGNKVRMYACGPTVYDQSHLGHARMSIVWDVVQRYLRFYGYDVIYVRNVTDVDDKIIKRAAELDTTPERVAREFTYTFWRDMHALNVEPPDVEPKCTEFMEPMFEFIAGLIDKGHAYAVDGDVYFEVATFKEYGKLGKKSLEDLLVGAREQTRSQDDLAGKKRSPVDFALWKGAAPDSPGWESPWGYGRPGWHLECSTMTSKVLGKTIDIHTGGEDLVFPHHENEIAQSEALHGVPMAKYWLHNSFVQVSSEKMSKSLGNFSTIDALLKEFSGDTIRLFVLQKHYRHPIDFTLDSLKSTRTAMSRLLRAASTGPAVEESNGDSGASENSSLDAKDGADFISRKRERLTRENAETRDPVNDEVTKQFRQDFTEAMNNDLNTAAAVSHLFTLADKIFLEKDASKQSGYSRVLREYGQVLGLTFQDTRKEIDTKSGAQIMDLVLDLRQQARVNKDYATADKIRSSLSDIGISVMDSAGSANWEKE